MTPGQAELDYYRTPGPMSAIDPELIDGLDPDPAALARVVRGLLVHRDWAPLMGLDLDEHRLADQHIRPVEAVLRRIREFSPEPLGVRRAPERRMVGVCRHFALLHVALLRAHGIPARARAGFGGYFGPGWADHWITERWDGRWVRHDAQIGSLASSTLGLDFDTADQPAGKFLTGAEAWLVCRRGEADPDEFGIGDQRGLWFVFGDLALDLAALNKIELLPWDGYGEVRGGGPQWQPDEDEQRRVDQLARVICDDQLSDVRREYLTKPVPTVIRSFLGPTPVQLGSLVDAEVLPA